ncbi:MAG: hypothetical protein H8D42_02605 [Candidatus Marinimicrobia bacterium]|nr:hypothetical protein [Candidatus Neomarinimicrobiota bacterium]MBL7191171.1 hypothetical protein [bacterium]
MGESATHKRLKNKAPGSKEVTLSSGKRVDSLSFKRATEIERKGTSTALKKAALRLKESDKPQKVLQVPQKDMFKAVAAMKDAHVSGTVKNLSGTKRQYVGLSKVKVK